MVAQNGCWCVLVTQNWCWWVLVTQKIVLVGVGNSKWVSVGLVTQKNCVGGCWGLKIGVGRCWQLEMGVGGVRTKGIHHGIQASRRCWNWAPLRPTIPHLQISHPQSRSIHKQQSGACSWSANDNCIRILPADPGAAASAVALAVECPAGPGPRDPHPQDPAT